MVARLAVVEHRPAHALDRLLRAMNGFGVLAAARDRPERGLLAVAGPMAFGAHRVPAGLMLPVIIAAADDQPLLGPDDLRADGEALALQAVGNGRGLQRACQT